MTPHPSPCQRENLQDPAPSACRDSHCPSSPSPKVKPQDTTPFTALIETELKAGITLFFDLAEEILRGSKIALTARADRPFAMEQHFFSALFHYSYMRTNLPVRHRILYSAVNQCLRGMVTGCDNLLDDEYKTTLETDLPKRAPRFRSVVDIMVSDRVLMALMVRAHEQGMVKQDHIVDAAVLSLHALLESGIQEAGEEQGKEKILSPEKVLSTIHSVKTGKLFQAPWAIPQHLETALPQGLDKVKQGLFLIGMGCQVMDDMVDLAMDLQMNRHNYIAALIHHDAQPPGLASLEKSISTAHDATSMELLNTFPKIRGQACAQALDYLEKGFSLLLAKEHWGLIPGAITFLKHRIGAWEFFGEH